MKQYQAINQVGSLFDHREGYITAERMTNNHWVVKLVQFNKRQHFVCYFVQGEFPGQQCAFAKARQVDGNGGVRGNEMVGERIPDALVHREAMDEYQWP